MSIEIEWELSDAPPSEGDDSTLPPAQPPRRPPPADRRATTPRRRGRWLAAAALLGVVAALAVNYVSGLGWQRIQADVTALIRYEEQMSLAGETRLVLRLQDYGNRQWMALRTQQVDAHQAAPLPVPVLAGQTAPGEVGTLQLLDTDWVSAPVYRQYEAVNGRVLTFVLPQFYRRLDGSEDWVRTGTPDTYWGGWQDWQSPHLFVRHSARDQALVDRLGPRLEAILAEACGLWEQTCADLPPAKLFLSGYLGSLEYDPLDNIRVRVEFGQAGAGEALPADYFLSVPSPHLAGSPADETTERFLADYLAVRLIASLASAAAPNHRQAQAYTAEAVHRLGLAHADPGFAANYHPLTGGDGIQSSAAPASHPSRLTNAPMPVAGVTLITRLNPPVELFTHEVQPGDTLLGIAVSHGVSAASIARLNGIDDPDQILAGTRLLVPRHAGPAGESQP